MTRQLAKTKGQYTIQNRSVTWIMVKSPPCVNHDSLHEIQFERQLPSGIIHLNITYKLNHKHPRELLIPLLNISNKDVKIPKNTILGSINPITDVNIIQEVSWQKIRNNEGEAVKNTAQDPHVHKLLPIFPENSNFRIHANDSGKPAVILQDIEIPQAARDKLNHMINNQFTCIISNSSAYFCRSNLVEMDLPTTGLPITSKPYTIPLIYKSFADEEIKLLEDIGCISKSLSDRALPICIVKKKPYPSQLKQLQLRMCIDYRNVNQSLITTHNGNNSKVVSTLPLPKIQELLSRLVNCKYFSSLDLHSGYYHISLTEDAKRKTAFVTAHGKYQWNVVPCGLAAIVSTFQYLMSQVLTGLNHFAFTYLDDILIFSNSWEEHLEHLENIFNRFKSAGLKLNEANVNFSKNNYII